MPVHPDFATLDRHVLRVAHGSLLDNPLDHDPDSVVWIATIWPDHQQPGDVIEFGADIKTTADRWYCFTVDAGATSLALVGPFPTPGEASDDGRRSFRTAAELMTP